MNKSYKTLKQDIENVLETGEGWTKEIENFVTSSIGSGLTRQLTPRIPGGTLRMSNLGKPCERALWYDVNITNDTNVEKLPPNAKNKFIFGDIIEAWTLGLVMAAGHKVEGLQTPMEINGIKGSRDCVIDGVLFDVKSASSFSFAKFKDNGLLKEDPFGYLSQLSSYLYASRNDPVVVEKNIAGFLAVDKQLGTVAVDVYDLSTFMKNKEEEVEHKKQMVKKNKPPARPYEDVEDGKSGNRKLNTQCSYCQFKKLCWPELQTYLYSGGPRFLTKVVREPNVFKV